MDRYHGGPDGWEPSGRRHGGPVPPGVMPEPAGSVPAGLWFMGLVPTGGLVPIETSSSHSERSQCAWRSVHGREKHSLQCNKPGQFLPASTLETPRGAIERSYVLLRPTVPGWRRRMVLRMNRKRTTFQSEVGYDITVIRDHGSKLMYIVV